MAGAAGIDSDDFSSGSLESWWTEVDGTGDGTVSFEGSGTSDAWCVLTHGGTGDHTWGTTNNSLALTQPCTDDDFQIELKIETIPGSDYQEMGLCAIIDGEAPLLFYIYLSGSQHTVYAARPWTYTTSTDISTPSAPYWLRMDRTGDVFTMEYSTNGTGWTELGSPSFSTTVTDVGFFAGHDVGGGFTAKADYFFENSDRIDPEDPVGGTRRVMVIS